MEKREKDKKQRNEKKKEVNNLDKEKKKKPWRHKILFYSVITR